MVDEQVSGGESAPFRCPWCSAALPAPNLEDCPSCGATLTSSTDASQLPGVTAIDHEAIARSAREALRQPRSRFLSWLSGDYAEEGPAATEAIAPPDPAVRREMLRLKLAAEIADRQAEADAIMADAAVEGRPIPSLEPEPSLDAEPSLGAEASLEAEEVSESAPPEAGTPEDAAEPAARVSDTTSETFRAGDEAPR